MKHWKYNKNPPPRNSGVTGNTQPCDRIPYPPIPINTGNVIGYISLECWFQYLLFHNNWEAVVHFIYLVFFYYFILILNTTSDCTLCMVIISWQWKPLCIAHTSLSKYSYSLHHILVLSKSKNLHLDLVHHSVGSEFRQHSHPFMSSLCLPVLALHSRSTKYADASWFELVKLVVLVLHSELLGLSRTKENNYSHMSCEVA